MDIGCKVKGLLEKFWKWRLENSPEFATFCGFHDYDDKLESYELEVIQERQETVKSLLEEAEVLSKNNDMNSTDRENLDFFIAELGVFLKGFNFKGYYFPLNYLEGVHLEFERLMSAMTYEVEEDYQKLLSRFAALPKQISEMIQVMKAAIKEELTYYSVSVATVPEQLKQLDQIDVLEKKPEDCVFYKPFLTLPDSISDEKKQSLLREAVKSISKDVIPAFKTLKEFLEVEYFKHVRLQPGITTLPGGNELYQSCLNFHLGFQLTPKEVHEMGLAEVARISKQIEEVMESLGYKEMSVKGFTEKLRNEEQFYFEKPEELLEAYKVLVFQKISPKMVQLFKTVPECEVIIEPFPPSMSNGPVAYYLAGTPDGKRPGVYYVNVGDVKSAPKYQMVALALHEAVPGHHLQQSHNFCMKELPNFRKFVEDRKYSESPSRFPLHSAYVEGWGLYSEFLGIELGLYEDKYDFFGYLSQEIFRAARLVVDTGIHALNWSIEQAVTYMMENTASSKRDIENEVNRYITWPGQACAYKVGELKIKSLRKMAESNLGSKFNVQDFHEIVLNSFGPLDVLEKKILEFIKSQQNIEPK